PDPSRRVLGVDLGERRIGLAVSDPTGSVARPLRVLERSGPRAADRRAILSAATEVAAGRIVVGLPRSMSGSEGPAARAVREEVEALQSEAGPIEVTVHDERLTTVMARRVQPRRRQRRREPVDDLAAALILQSYLDSHS
ncbi:MAG: Holliday junction resolvase RuvX, partial [Acidimicrobiia bacterium]